MIDSAPRDRVPGVVAQISRALDSGTDGFVVAFAVWTVLYHLGLLFDLPAVVLLVVSIVLSVVAMVALRRLSSGDVQPANGNGGARTAPSSSFSRWFVGSALLALAAAVAAGLVPDRAWWVAAVGCIGSVVLLAVGLWRGRIGDPVATRPATEARDLVPVVVVVLLVALAASVLALLVIRPNSDDIYYVNRSAWVAQHGSIPLRDTMYGDETLSAFPGAGIPLSSIETLQGAIARVLHISAGSVVFDATPFLATFLAVWVLWRLVREWAPRRAVLVFGVAMLYLAWGGTSARSFGNFHFVRDWQGKAIFVSLLVPLAYVYLTRWWSRQDPTRSLVLCGAAGVAAVGLTSSATFLVPLTAVGACVGILWERNWRRLVAPAALLFYPVLCGLIVHFAYAKTDAETDFAPAGQTFHQVAGHGLFGPLTLLGVLLVAVLVRPGAAARVALGATVMTVIVLIPGVLELMRDVTGAPPVLWRVMWVAPVPAAVGMLAAMPVPMGLLRGVARLVPAAAAAGVILGAGAPVWARANDVAGYGTDWKLPPRPWQDARAVLDSPVTSGRVLAPAQVMSAIATTTTRVHVVNPRTYYTTYMDEPEEIRRARLFLTYFADRPRQVREFGDVAAALQLLDVDTVCMPASRRSVLGHLASMGYADQAPAGARLVCAARPSS